MNKLKQKIRRWLIVKLAAIAIEDHTPYELQTIINRWANNTLDKELAERLDNAFNPVNTNHYFE